MALRPSWARGVLALAALALSTTSSLSHARLFGPNLFVAGDGFKLEQAVSDAAKQHTSQDAPAYKLLVVGSEIQRIETSAESSDVHDLLQMVMIPFAVAFRVIVLRNSAKRTTLYTLLARCLSKLMRNCLAAPHRNHLRLKSSEVWILFQS